MYIDLENLELFCILQQFHHFSKYLKKCCAQEEW